MSLSYGGDEFILVIPGISSVRAIQVAARRGRWRLYEDTEQAAALSL